MLVEKYDKQADGSWVLHVYGEQDFFVINTVDMEMAVMALYRNVVFE